MTATTALLAQTRRGRPWWTQLWVWVLVGMALGILLGIAAPDAAAAMGPLGDGFGPAQDPACALPRSGMKLSAGRLSVLITRTQRQSRSRRSA